MEKGRVVVVTGGAGGTGSKIVDRFDGGKIKH